MKQKHFIDTHKAMTFTVVLFLMGIYHQWENPTAWAYLALHGIYGILWVTKSRVYPDRSWEKPTTLWYGLVIFGGLSLYWVAPWLLAARSVQAPAWYLGMCVAINILGVFWHYVADMQKFTALQLRPGQLISDGLWTRCRNPNYFGELLIYLSFALLAMHWAPLVILALWVAFVWAPKMIAKDRSLARYPDFAAYKARSKLFIPFLI